MVDVTYAKVLAQAESLDPQDRRRLAEKLRQDIEAEAPPRRSVLEILGTLPWDGRDVDQRIRKLRDEWDDR